MYVQFTSCVYGEEAREMTNVSITALRFIIAINLFCSLSKVVWSGKIVILGLPAEAATERCFGKKVIWKL